MPTIMLVRGRPETIGTFSATGVAPNDYRIPQDIQGARLAWEVVVTGAPTAVTTFLDVSVDGINYVTGLTAFTSTISSAAVTADLNVVPVEGIMAIKAHLGTLTGGTAPTVTVIVRCT